MVEVTQASIARVPDLAFLFGRAFVDDPNALWSLGAQATEDQAIEWFRAFLALATPHGLVWEAEHGLGAAIWFPPGEEHAYRDIEEGVRGTIASLSDDGGVRNASYWDWIAAHLPAEPHWFLDSLAVRQDQRGRGIGRALIDIGLAAAKRAGSPAFLETARPENVPLYEHLGFRVTVEEDRAGSGPHVWFMRSDP
jgi:GNAT superfamily N-acetyltransferase